MFRNYLKIGFRNIIKEKFYSTINIMGLAVGMACTLIILAYIIHETSYDAQHSDVDRLHRVNMTAIWTPGRDIMSSTPPSVAQALLNEYPEVESVLRINTPGAMQVSFVQDDKVDRAFNETGILAADSNFFDFFAFDLKEGDKRTALKEKNTAVISDEMAEKYFGDESPIGKVLLFGDDRIPVKVTGVTTKQASNLHFNFDFLLSIYTNENIKKMEWSWIWTQVVTYVKLKEGTSAAALGSKLYQLAPKYAVKAFQRLGIDIDEFQREKGQLNFYLQPVRDIHLYSANVGNRIGPVSDVAYIYIFASVALFIMIIACINFMNLSTARATVRAKEIGVRKVMGSQRIYLIFQFLTESIMMSFLATLLGLGILEIIRMTVIESIIVDFEIQLFSDPILTIFLLLMPLLIGIIAGSYPAFYLTSFNAAGALKGNMKTGKKSLYLRNGLVILQFVISVTLISCTVIVYDQLNYFNEKNLGYDKENILVINFAEKLGPKLESYRNKLESYSSIKDATVGMSVPGRASFEDFLNPVGSSDDKIPVATLKIDEHYIDAFNIEVLAGRDFSKSNPTDINGTIINETAMHSFGWTIDNVIGQKISYYGESQYEVIGVVKDYHFAPLRFTIAPHAFFHIDSDMWGDFRVVALKVDAQNAQNVLSYAESEWKKYAEGAPFNFSFLEEEHARQYESERRTGKLFSVFTIITVLIACIGLFGLAAYTIEQRRKEIGIRKVLGSPVSTLVLMLNGGFTKLVLIAFLISIPVAWYAMEQWLQQFPFRIPLNIGTFILGGILAIVITWLTVGFQSLRAAKANPVDTLRDE
ncbi:ABC transporter permease [Fulvivirgaceae bacterium BMA10]|uniref:ABC transporter permease n=1 Tax=Splendidivirga corallicola TaxID=3051826 RepID=A0ABT8KVL2_9BACT|nr:ABC transporter permease [Fulvivirgaceae bacterium BMA10]